jgi:hypothetical protein
VVRAAIAGQNLTRDQGLIGTVHIPEGTQLQLSKPSAVQDIIFEFRTQEEGVYVLSLPAKLAPQAKQQLQRLEDQGAFRETK